MALQQRPEKPLVFYSKLFTTARHAKYTFIKMTRSVQAALKHLEEALVWGA